jgi:hypothetical protein
MQLSHSGWTVLSWHRCQHTFANFFVPEDENLHGCDTSSDACRLGLVGFLWPMWLQLSYLRRKHM